MAAFWLVAATVAIGVVLGCAVMLDRRGGWAMRMAATTHATAGVAGVFMVLAALWGGTADVRGFGRVAAVLVVAALTFGAVLAVERGRGGRPGALPVMLHAVLGAAGLVMLAAW